MSLRGTSALSVPLPDRRAFLPRTVVSILLAIALGGLPACGRSGDGSGDGRETAAADSSSAEKTGTVSAANSGDKGNGAETSERGRDRKSKSKGSEEAAEDEALPIEVTLVGRGRIESVVRSATNLEAEAQVIVIAEAARQVRQLFVEEGDVVQKGKVLLRLENDEQRSNLAKAQVSYDQAERELDRQKRLFEQNLAAERALNDAQHEYDRARITLDDARRELGYTEVRAPIGGTITQRFVKIGDQIGLGQQLFEIVDFESLVARVYVPEGQVAGIRPGQTARVSAEAAGDREFQAKVDRVAPIVDPKSGTVKVTVAVGEQPGLLPGMFVDVDIVTSVHEDVVLLPKRALVYDEDRAYAFTAAGGKATRILVAPILADRDWVEPAEGFVPGDTLVVAGQAGLKDGSKVEILAGGDSAS